MADAASKNDFSVRAPKALNDPTLRANFRRAMDGLMVKRAAQFEDKEAWNILRARGAAAKARVVAQLPELLEQLEAKCTANGIQVHWAETTAEANDIVLSILQKHGAKSVIKGKSMVSEEMELNHHLEAHGIRAVESDLGEYIIQLAGEAPSHIVMPCIHKNKAEIAQLFEETSTALAIPRMWTPLRRPPARNCAEPSRLPMPASRASISQWPRPARWCWWRTRAMAVCPPPCRLCISR